MAPQLAFNFVVVVAAPLAGFVFARAVYKDQLPRWFTAIVVGMSSFGGVLEWAKYIDTLAGWSPK